MSYVIVGDGIAGSSAAEAIREEDVESDVTVITDEGEPLYNRILIKEHAKGKLPEAPISIHDDGWYEERDIDLQLNTYVTDVDPDAHEVHTHDGDTYAYDKLLIATGGTPIQLPVENSDADGVHHFWTFQDARKIREHAEQCDTGIVVGAGLLGMDFAAVCAEQDIDAHYLMRGDRWWRYALTADGAEIIHDTLEGKGVTPVLESGVDHFEVDDDGHVTAAVDPNGDRYEGEFCGIAIGLDFNVEWLRGSGVEMDDGVLVDEYMQTSVEDIYAAGDITRFHDTILGERAQNGSWGSAREQGDVAGRNMATDGKAKEFRWVSTYSISHFDFSFLSFGHPTEGEEYAQRKYSEDVYRRLAFKNGQLIGGVLIGDLSQQSTLKQIIKEERQVAGKKEALLEPKIDVDALEAPPQAD
jgi:NAD(P)H-nitrite reductase large subunit